MTHSIIHGDCLEVMRTLDAASVDAVVTDPPYGLGFMGKGWDHGVPGAEFWAEALRVAKPGAHLLAFGGTRTHHRLMCAIEDAGWEIRDCLMWLYGSGFPKSLDVGKAIDKAAGAERRTIGIRPDAAKRTSGTTTSSGWATPSRCNDLTAPATDAAKRWSGWGTALKPAWEPIILARKPLDGTVAANVTAHGCGGLNIDGCRIEGTKPKMFAIDSESRNNPIFQTRSATSNGDLTSEGRWPANLMLDEEAGAMLDGQAPNAGGGGKFVAVQRERNKGLGNSSPGPGVVAIDNYGDTGGASRFFYCPKASKADRDEGLEGMPERLAAAMHGNLVSGQRLGGDGSPIKTPLRSNHHPTVKPTALMRYLCRLVTPPGGLVLDPFTGSGSTGKAAALEGFNFIGIEREAEYVEIARARIAGATPREELFTGAA